MMRKKISMITAVVLTLVLMVGTLLGVAAKEEKLPELKVAYIFTDHHTPFMMAADKGESLKVGGLYLKEVVKRQKYVLMNGSKPVANIEVVVTKNGSETTTMMSQGHIDMSLASSSAIIAAVDKGAKMKILCPVHSEGIGFVVDKNSKVNSWDDFLQFVKKSDQAVKVGYHSPTSAPIILLEAALQDAKITYTNNPADRNADILLVDLKGTNNLIPALNSNQVDAWVAPSPYPALAETTGTGKMVLDMKNLPPKGKWYDFPCCVVAATDKTIETYPEVVQAFVTVVAGAAEYAEHHKDEAAKVITAWTGVAEEAAKRSSIKYTADPSKVWVQNLGLVYDAMKKAGQLSGRFASKNYQEIQTMLFDFSFINKTLHKK
jgi:NitT/TauT family transport system substrate-binding protein